MKKIRLLTPGPTPVPERLALRMARPILHHRSPEFEAVVGRVREGLQWLFETKHDVILYASSGTGETVRMEIFKSGAAWRFRARALERNVVVLDRGTAVC